MKAKCLLSFLCSSLYQLTPNSTQAPSNSPLSDVANICYVESIQSPILFDYPINIWQLSHFLCNHDLSCLWHINQHAACIFRWYKAFSVDNKNQQRALPTTSQSLLKHNTVITGELWGALRLGHGSDPLKSLHTTADIYNNHQGNPGVHFLCKSNEQFRQQSSQRGDN